MISAPLHPSLRIDSALAAPQALRNLAVDLALTLPAYVVIFSALWRLLCRCIGSSETKTGRRSAPFLAYCRA
jgi:hypothetical protein